MKQSYFTFLIGAGLLVSGSTITGLADADMDNTPHKRSKLMAKKLDINNDGMISREELTSRLNSDGMIDRTEFNGRVVAMFQKMGSNGDGGWDGEKTRKMKRHHYGKMKNKTGGYTN